MKTLFTMCFLIFFSSTLNALEIVEIHLLDNLDDNRGYCLDIKGFKRKAKISTPKSWNLSEKCGTHFGMISVSEMHLTSINIY